MTKQSSDILIVGGGLIGLMTAWALRHSGSITVIDQSYMVKPSARASWAAGGILAPMYPWRHKDAVNRLVQYSQSLYPTVLAELQTLTGIDTQVCHNGMLILDETDKTAVADWCQRFNGQAQWLTAAEAIQQVPGLRANGDALFLPALSHLRPPALLKALYMALTTAGIRLLENKPVQQLQIESDVVVGVQLTDQYIYAEHTIITAGAWSAGLLRSLDSQQQGKPIKGQMLAFDCPALIDQPMLMHGNRYCLPRHNGIVAVGSTLEDVGFNEEITKFTFNKLRNAAIDMYPAIANAPLIRHWSGFRPYAVDGIPTIGQHARIKNLWLNTGHYRNGIVLAAGSAQLLADQLLNRLTATAVDGYQPK